MEKLLNNEVFDAELMQMGIDLQTISTQNSMNYHFIAALKKKTDGSAEETPSTDDSQADLEGRQSILNNLTDLHIDQICATAQNDEQYEVYRELALTYQQRNCEMMKIHDRFFEVVKKQQELGFEAEHKSNIAIAAAACEMLAQNQKQCEELTLKLEVNEKTLRESNEQDRQELAKFEKELEACQAELVENDKEALEEEVASLTAQNNRRMLKKWDNDDDSSIDSDSMDIEPEGLKMINLSDVDFESFFKNPNDFPELIGSTKKQALKTPPRATTSKIGNKPDSLVSPLKLSKASSFASVLKRSPKMSRTKEKISVLLRKSKSPKAQKDLFEQTSPTSARPPKKIIRRSAPSSTVEKSKATEAPSTSEEIPFQQEPEVTVQPEPEEVAVQSEPEEETVQSEAEEVVLKPRTLTFEAAEPEDENPQLVTVELEIPVENPADDPVQDNTVVPEEVPKEIVQIPAATSAISPTNSEGSLFGGCSEINRSGTNDTSGANLFDSSFSGDESHPKAKEGGELKDSSFDSGSEGGGDQFQFNFFSGGPSETGTGGFFGK